MIIESVEGQAMELGWRKENECNLTDDDYLRMILKKNMLVHLHAPDPHWRDHRYKWKY
jgi:hypothetical protein